MEITIHDEKITHFTFHGEKKGRSRVTKIPLTTLFSHDGSKTKTIKQLLQTIDHFTVVCLVTWPLNESEAGVQ